MNYVPSLLIKEEATRQSVSYRYDMLYWQFIYYMAVIADFGAKKYGDYNWQKSRLSGQDSPINHALMHLTSYILKKPYDHEEIGGADPKFHLVAAAFNCMMEFWYEEQMPLSDK